MPLRQSSTCFRLGPLVVAVALLMALGLASAPHLHAQFMYLDSNGDGLSSEADILNPEGVPTSVAIYLDTSRNPDSSTSFCTLDAQPLTINSYEFILHTTGGSVSFGPYTNARPEMTTSFGNGAANGDFYVGFGGSLANPPGLYLLGALTITVLSGSPSVSPVTSTSLDSHFGTTFGTLCSGQDQDNTYKLGLDWFGIAGCGPPEGGNAAPSGAVPSSVHLETALPAVITGEFSDSDPTDSLELSVASLPGWLHSTKGAVHEGRVQLRLYGIPPEVGPGGASFGIAWSASDGVLSQTSQTVLRVDPPKESVVELEARALQLVIAEYQHGLPHDEIRSLGSRAIPYLLSLLSSNDHKVHWHKIAVAIGRIGDPAYFDALHAIIWNQHSGSIDLDTYTALKSVQGNLYAMASANPAVLDYLIATSTPAAWMSVPWSVAGKTREATAQAMARATLIAIALTDSERAGQALDGLPLPPTPQEAGFIGGLRSTNERVRRVGVLRYWQDKAARRAGVEQ